MKNKKKCRGKQTSLQSDKMPQSFKDSTPSPCNSDERAFPDLAQLKQIILESISKGTFLLTCQNLSFAAGQSAEHKQNLSQMLVSLHNEGKIDLLKEAGRFCNVTEKQSLPHFGLWISHFSSLFSKVDCPLESICTLFVSFDKRWAKDTGNGIWWEFLLDRFQRDADSRRKMLRLAELQDAFCPGLLRSFAAGLSVEPGQAFNKALDLLTNPGKRSKCFFNAILFALSGADWKTLNSQSQVAFWKIIAAIVAGGEPPFDWHPLYLLCHRLRLSGLGGTSCGDILQRVLSLNDPVVLAMATINLAVDWAGTDASERQWSLEAFSGITPDNGPLLQNLDGFLERIVHDGFVDTATGFLTSYLVRWNVRLSVFPRFVESVKRCVCPLGNTATSWFLSGNQVLERAAGDLISFEIGDDPIPTIDIDQIRNTKESLLPVAAKMIGHLFYKPKTMFSFLFPCLDYMDDKEKQELAPVLLDPVCLSYHDGIRKWMESDRCHLEEPSRAFLGEILERAEADTARLSKADPCPELRPPLQLQVELMRVQENENRENMKEARSHSLLSVLAHNITLLHGKEWILYRPGGEGPLGRSVGEMKQHSISIALPRLPDAVGQEFGYRLMALKMGQWNINTLMEFSE